MFFCSAGTVFGQTGTWSRQTPPSGLWTDAANWSGNVIANGAGNAALFNLDLIFVNTTVTLGADRTIGSLAIGNSNSSGWTFNGNTITFAGATPTIHMERTFGINVNCNINSNITLDAATTVTNANTSAGIGSQMLALNGNVNLNGNKLTIGDGLVSIGIRRFSSGDIDINSGGTLYSVNGSAGALYDGTTGTITINSGGKWETSDTTNVAATTVQNIVLNGGSLSTATVTGNSGGGNGTTLKNNISVNAASTLNGNNSLGVLMRFRGSLTGSAGLTLRGRTGIEFQGDLSGYNGTMTGTDGRISFNPISVDTGLANTHSFSGEIAGNRPVVKNGAGTTILSGNNTYTGTTSINEGTLQISSIKNTSVSSSIGAPTTAADGTIAIGDLTTTGRLAYTGTGDTTNRVINLNGTTGGATLDQSGTGLLKFDSYFTATGAGSKTLTLQGSTTGMGEIAGAIVNNSATNRTALTKTGTGTWTLSGTNTYTGLTRVSGGTLIVNGSTAALSSVTVGNSGILGGNGAANGSVAINSGGTLAPGNSIDSLDTGAVVFLNGATYAYDLNTDVLNGDLLNVAGNLSLQSGAAINLNLSELVAGTVSLGSKLTLISYSGTWNNTTFSGFSNGSQFTLGNHTWKIDYADTVAGSNGGRFGKNVTITVITAVPEPTALMMVGSLSLLFLRRRRQA
jgi:autotransporter-associated beta strand protein